MEQMLRAALTQRTLQLERRRTNIGAEQPDDMVMGPDDMKEIFNTWRKDVRSWMRPSTLTNYDYWVGQGRQQRAHQTAKSAFNTYLFQLSGCKFLLHKFIELPIISLSLTGGVGQPARHLGTHLGDLVLAFEEHKKPPEYQDAVKRSQALQAHQHRLSCEIWWAQWNYTQGRKLSIQKAAGLIECSDLDADQQQLLKDFETRHSADALDKLLAQKKTPYRGAGAEAIGLEEEEENIAMHAEGGHFAVEATSESSFVEQELQGWFGHSMSAVCHHPRSAFVQLFWVTACRACYPTNDCEHHFYPEVSERLNNKSETGGQECLLSLQLTGILRRVCSVPNFMHVFFE